MVLSHHAFRTAGIFTFSMLSMLAGASTVHYAMKPDLVGYTMHCPVLLCPPLCLYMSR